LLVWSKFCQFLCTGARCEHTTVSKWINFRNFFTGKWADRDTYDRTIKIFEQDKPIVESQSPQLIPTDLNAELYVPADALQLQYRKLRQQILIKN
jgi:phenylpropionate dioxygenase-like ring-hydroxylating dioxygenase large terminal subunit